MPHKTLVKEVKLAKIVYYLNNSFKSPRNKTCGGLQVSL